jgi:hypothetical protein
MNARDFFTTSYALLVRDTVQRGGTRQGLEERLEQMATEDDMLQMRKRRRKMPESVAREQLAAMKMAGGPAPLRKRVR